MTRTKLSKLFQCTASVSVMAWMHLVSAYNKQHGMLSYFCENLKTTLNLNECHPAGHRLEISDLRSLSPNIIQNVKFIYEPPIGYSHQLLNPGIQKDS